MFVGYWGCPPRHVLHKLGRMHPFDEFIDLDIDMNAPSSGLVPDAYCQILTNIVDNAMLLRKDLRVIVATVGEDKCDGGRFVAHLLKDLGFPVMEVKNTETEPGEITIATSSLPLVEKVNRITDGVRIQDRKRYKPVKPTHGFWGVPPHDLRLLELFPDTTHVYGWIRCVEAGVPADLDLEMYVDSDVPTVFYAQTFCQKNALARYLAEKHDGMYIDCDGPLTNSVVAKVLAFIRLG